MTNYLIQSNNNLLNQHAQHKINWFFWDKRALQLARSKNKPILVVSIAFACPFSHRLMDFLENDSDIVSIVNENFMTILIDEGETPSVNQVLSLMATRGDGAQNYTPLAAVFSPDFKPWDVCPVVADPLDSQEIQRVLLECLSAFAKDADLPAQSPLPKSSKTGVAGKKQKPTAIEDKQIISSAEILIEAVVAQQNSLTGKITGNFLYPQIAALLRLTYAIYHIPELSSECLATAFNYTDSAFRHGVRDHVNGGYFSYRFRQGVPTRFSKSLATNATLLNLTLDLYAITQEPDLFDESYQQIEFLLGNLSSPEGGFISSLQEGETRVAGSYYHLDEEEITQVLPQEYHAIFKQMYYQKQLLVDGGSLSSLLGRYETLEKLASQAGISVQHCRKILRECVKALHTHCLTSRPALLREEKIFTRANALTASAFASAGWLLSDRMCHHHAQRILDYILANLWLEDTVYVGRVHLEKISNYTPDHERRSELLSPGNLDDYAHLLKAMLDFLVNDIELDRLEKILELAHLILENFFDDQRFEFHYQDKRYFSELEPLNGVADTNLPASVPLVLICFRRLTWLTGNAHYLDIANRCTLHNTDKTFANPVRFATMLVNATLQLSPFLNLWFIYDGENQLLADAERIPVYAGRMQYFRISLENLQKLAKKFPNPMQKQMAKLPKKDLQVVVTRGDEILEIIDKQVDIYTLERQIKQANRIKQLS